MNVASLELCKELFELSGWEDTNYCYRNHARTGTGTKKLYDRWQLRKTLPNKNVVTRTFVPAYDLGFLLRKLPIKRVKLRNYTRGWSCQWSEDFKDNGRRIRDYVGDSDTPENATCQLCIELFRQGILKREDKE